MLGQCQHRPRFGVARIGYIGFFLLGLLLAGVAQASNDDLADLSLEQLANIVVTSVSKQTESLQTAAASIDVITADDIRRAGANSLPEALRLAPNLQVARADANQYAISARGFNSVLANKMLVMIDGRTVYSPLFSGVFWEAQDVVMEDVERIEIISGPGGTVWGSNAVNGVINIITASSRNTQGAAISAGIGNEGGSGDDKLLSARYGGRLGETGNYRVYLKHTDRAPSLMANGTVIRDGSNNNQIGFRSDWGPVQNQMTLQGDAYDSDIDQQIQTRRIDGANLLARWNRLFEDGADLQVQAYYDHTGRDQPGSVRDRLDTFSLDVQHSLHPVPAHRVILGTGYRLEKDHLVNVNPAALAFLPANRNQHHANVFAQDEIALSPVWALTLGLKLEDNDYTGIETLPNLRLSWKATPIHFFWAALSRVVRAPSRIDRDLYVPGTPPNAFLAGGPDFQSETAKVAELGYRAQPTMALSFSLTGFYHDYDRLRSIEPSANGPVFQNRIEGTNRGIEAFGQYAIRKSWRVSAGWVQQAVKLKLKPDSADQGGLASLGNDPNHWLTLRMNIDLSPTHELDLSARRIGSLPNPAVPAYTAIDARFGWHVQPKLEFSVTARNLFDKSHAEWGAVANRIEVQRGIFAKVAWQL